MKKNIVRFLSLRVLSLCILSLCAPALMAQPVVVPQSVPNSQSTDDRARLHTEIASQYFQGGVLSVALEEANIAIKTDPSYVLAYSTRALIYAALRDFAAADADFKRAMSLAPNDPDVSNNYGWYLCQQRDKPKEAIPYFQNSFRNPLYTTPDIAYINAGECAMKARDYEGARSHLLQALRFGRNSAPLAQLRLATLAFREGGYTEARNRLQEVMRAISEPNAEILWLGVRIEHKLGNKSEESSLLAQLRRLYPTSNEYQTFLKGDYD
ncbi:MAG: type IV pilus biogenesis/stability protein PilW [Zoogloeaceae bacterium]|jgi:type IV pilus assembly protein PilF|nr:type IV pilus biogenesis/stability protein PilW [Zoogloeaceae bacterium]